MLLSFYRIMNMPLRLNDHGVRKGLGRGDHG